MSGNEQVGAPVHVSQTFGGLIRASVGQTTPVLAYQGVTFTVACTQSTNDPTQNVASILVSTDEANTCYSSLGIFTGNYVEFGPADGNVTVAEYDAGGGGPGGPFYMGGVAFSLVKPSGLVAFNGIMSLGVAVMGSDAVFSGVVFQ